MNPSLRADYCRKRQERFVNILKTSGCDAAFLQNRSHVHYFTGYWQAATHHPMALLFLPDDSTTLITGNVEIGDALVDTHLIYDSQKLGTLTEKPEATLLNFATKHLSSCQHVGTDFPIFAGEKYDDITPLLLRLRRKKDEDEIELLLHSIRATEAAYKRVREIIAPGISELDLYAEIFSTALKALGEPMSDFGNDFQSGTPGGTPRPRPVEAGELFIADVSAGYRGYRCDLCETFSVDKSPTPAQNEAHELISDLFPELEKRIQPGISCKELYQFAHEKLSNKNGWNFFHHLGHGIGISAHESPRLNPNWDNHFETGDLFTLEPGLYGKDLSGGIRIEHNYLLDSDGLRKLSTFTPSLI